MCLLEGRGRRLSDGTSAELVQLEADWAGRRSESARLLSRTSAMILLLLMDSDHTTRVTSVSRRLLNPNLMSPISSRAVRLHSLLLALCHSPKSDSCDSKQGQRVLSHEVRLILTFFLYSFINVSMMLFICISTRQDPFSNHAEWYSPAHAGSEARAERLLRSSRPRYPLRA